MNRLFPILISIVILLIVAIFSFGNFSGEDLADKTKGELLVQQDDIKVNKLESDEKETLSSDIKLSEQVNTEIEDIDERLSLPSLETTCYDSHSKDDSKTICKDLIEVKYLPSGDVWKKTYRHHDGKIYTNVLNQPDGYDNGYNFKFEEHEYWSYETESIQELADQGDKIAQYIFVRKIMNDAKNDEYLKIAEHYAFKAAKQGFTASLGTMSAIHRNRGEWLHYHAYRLAGKDKAPESFRRFVKIPESFTEEERTEIIKLAEEIKSRIEK